MHSPRCIDCVASTPLRRRASGPAEEHLHARSGLTIEEAELVEDNAVDVSFDVLRRYANAVGLQFDLHQLPA